MSLLKNRSCEVVLVTLLCVCAAIGIERNAWAHPHHDKASIFGAARSQGSLSTFIDLVKLAGHEDTLRTGGPITVLAPTDKAFEAIPADEFDRLLDDPKAVEAFLQRHVIRGSIALRDMLDSGEVVVVSGDAYPVTAEPKLAIHDAAVSLGDIECTNGTLHVINRVLEPAQRSQKGVTNE